MHLLLESEETERLLFRKLSPNDFDSWLPFHKNPLSTQYWQGGHPDPVTACQNWFDRVFYRYDNQLGGLNALIHKKDGKLLGQCGLLLQTVDGIEELEIGYSILPNYWKQGYAFEAAQKCKCFAFDNGLAKSLISIIPVHNFPSQKVALKNGMILHKKTIYKDNTVYIFRILNKQG